MTTYLDNKIVSLKESGNDENWVHKWITDKPERLGLGLFEIVAQELHHYKNKGGRLDILGFNRPTNTFYEIEVMLGECDSDHGSELWTIGQEKEHSIQTQFTMRF